MSNEFNRSSINTYLSDYTYTMRTALLGMDLDPALRACRFAHRIFVAGNGGSAAIADHLECDFAKGAKLPYVRSLVGSTALFSAIANDLGYEDVFSWQLERAELTFNDVVILISSSGNSPNIVNAALVAEKSESTLIGLCGFDGGMLKSLSNIKLHIPVHNYGVVEDAHSAIMHVIAQFIAGALR